MEESVDPIDPFGNISGPTESEGEVRRSRPSSATMGKFVFQKKLLVLNLFVKVYFKK